MSTTPDPTGRTWVLTSSNPSATAGNGLHYQYCLYIPAGPSAGHLGGARVTAAVLEVRTG